MEDKEAIDLIGMARAEVEWEYPIDYAEAFNKAVDALYKQIPTEPMVKIKREELGVCTGKCANCGEGVNSCMPYCMMCGQAILWEEGDNDERTIK